LMMCTCVFRSFPKNSFSLLENYMLSFQLKSTLKLFNLELFNKELKSTVEKLYFMIEASFQIRLSLRIQ
jgi:hypothetical protein